MDAKRRTRCSKCEALNERTALFCAQCGASLLTPMSPSPLPRRRRVTPGGAALGFALLLMLFGVLFALGTIVYRTTATTEQVIDPLAGRAGTTATTSTTLAQGAGTGGTTPTTQIRGTLIRPQAAYSSSALKPTSRSDFRATNLLDDDRTTAWIEGVPGPGVGEWVRFDFHGPVVLTRIEIANGEQKDDDRFHAHARVRSLKLEYSTGATQIVELLDIIDLQSITPRSQPTEWLRMTILSVYPDYLWDETALSDVRLFELHSR